MLSLQLSRPFAQISDRHFIQDFHDSETHFHHDAANPAFCLVRAGAALVKLLTDTTHGSERPLNVPDHLRQGDFVWGQPEAVTATDSSFALQNACRPEVI